MSRLMVCDVCWSLWGQARDIKTMGSGGPCCVCAATAPCGGPITETDRNELTTRRAVYEVGVREGITRTVALVAKRAVAQSEEAKRASASGAFQAAQRFAIGAEALATLSASVLDFLKQDVEALKAEQSGAQVVDLPFGGRVVVSGTPTEVDEHKRKVNARAAFLRGFCQQRGWPEDPALLSVEQLLEIRDQDGWVSA